MIEFLIQVPMKLAALELAGLHVRKEPAAWERLQACAESCRNRHAGTPPADIAGLAPARKLFRDLGMDPTKHRPCSESLLRRALQGQTLSSINTLVDAVNWCALDFLLPACVYDAAQIQGPVVVRPGAPGETYIGLTNKEVNLAGRYVLADAAGPFGNPMTDSLRTAVGEATIQALVTIFAPADLDPSALSRIAHDTATRIVEICGGRLESCTLFPRE